MSKRDGLPARVLELEDLLLLVALDHVAKVEHVRRQREVGRRRRHRLEQRHQPARRRGRRAARRHALARRARGRRRRHRPAVAVRLEHARRVRRQREALRLDVDVRVDEDAVAARRLRRHRARVAHPACRATWTCGHVPATASPAARARPRRAPARRPPPRPPRRPAAAPSASGRILAMSADTCSARQCVGRASLVSGGVRPRPPRPPRRRRPALSSAKAPLEAAAVALTPDRREREHAELLPRERRALEVVAPPADEGGLHVAKLGAELLAQRARVELRQRRVFGERRQPERRARAGPRPSRRRSWPWRRGEGLVLGRSCSRCRLSAMRG